MSDSCDPMDCSLPGSSVHGILQAKILEWVAISFSRESSRFRNQTWASCIAGFIQLDTRFKKKKCYIPQPVKLNIQQYYLSPKFFSPHSLTSDIKVLTKESLSFTVVKAKTDLAFEFSFKLRWWEIKPQESQYLCQHTTQ